MLRFDEATFYDDGEFFVGKVEFAGAFISLKGQPLPKESEVLSPLIVPGFVDVHTHLREPGFFYKESIASGTLAAASAGYTAIFTMPNLNPVPDSLETLRKQTDIINKDAKISVYPYGAITVGQKGEQLADMQSIAGGVIAFSDDGKGVQRDELMLDAMRLAKKLGKKIVAHCEDVSLIKKGGCIHDGKYAAKHGYVGISSESEWKQLKRDLELVRQSGCEYHICHVSTVESVELIRAAKKEGLRVTAETAPHYLVLTDDDLQNDGRFKMNPPLRAEKDRTALIQGLVDGTIDIIATDHAPHSAEEKSAGLKGSAFGVSGLEVAFPVLYTTLVKSGKLSLARLIEAMSINPRRIFGLESVPNGYAVLNLDEEWTICGEDFLSKGKATPFEGMKVKGRNQMTIINGEIIWKR